MITFPSAEALSELRNTHDADGGCVTLYVPLLAAETPGDPNRIALKNALKEAKRILEQRQVPSRTLQATLAQPNELLHSRSFWQVPHQTLALFAAPDYIQYYYLPEDCVEEELFIGDHFELQQLEACVAADTTYYLLQLSHKGSHLYRGTRTSFEEISLRDAAGPMAQVLRIDEYPEARELHPIAPASAGRRSEGYHQQYSPEDTDKQMLSDYFRLIDKQVNTVVPDRHPLLLAGVAYLVALYRKVNSYPSLLSQSIAGSFDNIPLSELHAKAWEVAREQLVSHSTRGAS